MMIKPVFGIDVDGVIRDFLGGCVKLYNMHTGENATADDCFDYDLSKSFSVIKDARSWFLSGDRLKTLMLESRPFDGAVHAANKIGELSKVVLITNQIGTDAKIWTLEWLEKNGIRFDEICFLQDKSIVRGLDYFIDDKPENFIGCDAKCGVLITAPYNISVNVNSIDGCKCGRMRRFSSLETFFETMVSYLK